MESNQDCELENIYRLRSKNKPNHKKEHIQISKWRLPYVIWWSNVHEISFCKGDGVPEAERIPRIRSFFLKYKSSNETTSGYHIY